MSEGVESESGGIGSEGIAYCTTCQDYPYYSILQNNLSLIFQESSEIENVELITVEQEDFGSLSYAFKDSKLQKLVFNNALQRFNLECMRIRYSSTKDSLYFSVCPTFKQEFSMELDCFEEDIIVDFDKDDKIIGFAILRAKEKYLTGLLDNFPDHKWLSFNQNPSITSKPKKVKKPKRTVISTPKTKKNVLELLPENTPCPFSCSLIPKNLPRFNHFYFLKIASHLSWAICSPQILRNDIPLESKESFGDIESDIVYTMQLNSDLPLSSTTCRNVLLALEKDPTPFYDWIAQRMGRTHVLGGYFALLIQFWMNYVDHWTENIAKFQLYHMNKTLGDLDFLFYDTITNEWNHLEVGVKFFLLDPSVRPQDITKMTDLKYFVGSHSRRETLLTYVLKTKSQIDISSIPHVEKYLKKENKFPTRKGFMIKGYLFYPLSDEWYSPNKRKINKIPLSLINPKHSFGWWTQYPLPIGKNTSTKNVLKDIKGELMNMQFSGSGEYHDILQLENSDNEIKREKLKYSKFCLLEKKDYLAPVFLAEGEEQLYDYQQFKQIIAEYFHHHLRSLFVAEVIPIERSMYRNVTFSPIKWVEITRGWIVSHQWNQNEK